MRNVIVLIIFSSLLFIAPAFAGPGHEHDQGHSHAPISSEDAAKKATDRIQKLIEAGKIAQSWASVKADKVEQKTFSNGPEWVISFKNDQVGDVSKQTLYMFYSLSGHYIAANYTGI